MRFAVYNSINSDRVQRRRYRKEDLSCDTLFEKIPHSKPLFVPGYNPSPFWAMGVPSQPLKYGYSIEETEEEYEKEFQYRKEKLFTCLEDSYPFLMCHFHKSDFWHHLHAPDNKVRDEEKIQALYEEMDALAADIKEQAEGNYDWVLFMSDHGLPMKHGHNENAFYSSNLKLGLDEPHITDFHDIILERVNEKEEKEILGIEV